MRTQAADLIVDIERCEALQQPLWEDHGHVRRVRAILAARPPLVVAEQVDALRELLAQVAAGEALVVQAGDCSEDPADNTAAIVARKAAVLDLLAGTLKLATQQPVVRVGRIAGQFAKPRSKPYEQVGAVELPAYRGHMVNDPDPELGRQADPLRILAGYMAAGGMMEHLGWRGAGRPGPRIEAPVWTSHEALLLDYELPMIRTLADGRRWLSSTHWPWVGDRTRQLDGAHVALLAAISNPVACKVGPSLAADELVRLCERLDPHRTPGRLTLIARMGAGTVLERLPSLLAAVRRAGHPVVWLCDPMHGNTIATPSGFKTRLVGTIAQEVREFRQAVDAAGAVAGGLHLETTPDDVTECADDASALGSVGERYTTLCDPRLTPWQAVAAVLAWTAGA
ncbi:3-deoxy-7-phosphoheptulonate synthase [Solirubrobacter phytolaccae]|uniref:Phospho-2-dehydro-3-deoxyheptonate aldolase n=1 Tax=Solirubrobacter phytolaccae TaxID=1404360 RepID=A0A9X3N8H2_9ACTN|nr:3-deoxy-7-phosphoheptulonate synthase [Solirubrobacter phytolaccae]MDA0181693.1 3-deoxy-7-phosphoheptulonate synthase [Solirubrobacter phytolaccae]